MYLIKYYVIVLWFFVKGICAEGAGITRYYDFRFYFIEGLNYRLDCEILYQQNLIVHSHDLSPMQICDNHDELQLCLSETKSLDKITNMNSTLF